LRPALILYLEKRMGRRERMKHSCTIVIGRIKRKRFVEPDVLLDNGLIYGELNRPLLPGTRDTFLLRTTRKITNVHQILERSLQTPWLPSLVISTPLSTTRRRRRPHRAHSTQPVCVSVPDARAHPADVIAFNSANLISVAFTEC
jgi:hypothetical protein